MKNKFTGRRRCMKIVVINGTPVKGITCFMKETFLRSLSSLASPADAHGSTHTVTEFYPDDLPPFCTGCKSCFLRGEEHCPHSADTAPVWEAMLEADLLVFAYPVYALHAPASIKSLLDHLCVYWLVHRPDPAFFAKTAVILTNSVGAPNTAAQKDVKTSLNWMGLSRVYSCGAPMMGDIFIHTLTDAHRKMLEKRMAKLAKKIRRLRPYRSMNAKVSLLFRMAKLQHKMVLKTEASPSLDNLHYIRHGWLKR